VAGIRRGASISSSLTRVIRHQCLDKFNSFITVSPESAICLDVREVSPST